MVARKKGVGMNWLDLAIVIVWALAAFWGYKTGLVSMLFPVVVVVVGLVLGGVFGGMIAEQFAAFTDDVYVQAAAAYIVIFIVVILVASLLMRFLETGSRFIPTSGLVDSLAGGLVGVLAGFVFLSGALAVMQKLPYDQAQQPVVESRLGSLMADNFRLVVRSAEFIPEDWDRMYLDAQDAVREFAEGE